MGGLHQPHPTSKVHLFLGARFCLWLSLSVAVHQSSEVGSAVLQCLLGTHRLEPSGRSCVGGFRVLGSWILVYLPLVSRE